MNVVKTQISDVLIFEPEIFGDERGFFMESFNQKIFDESVGRKINFVQDNHSKSKKGVLRGLHYQEKPFSQGKLVRCVSGSVFDVAVDLRPKSATFGAWVGVFLSDENKKQLWIPEGFAHGFLVISSYAEFLYKTTDYYNKNSERSILWNDKDLKIEWPLVEDITLSEKDRKAPSFREMYKGLK